MYVTNVYMNENEPVPYCLFDNGCILNYCGGDGCIFQLF